MESRYYLLKAYPRLVSFYPSALVNVGQVQDVNVDKTLLMRPIVLDTDDDQKDEAFVLMIRK